MYYSNIIASSYKFYARRKTNLPYFQAIIYVILCQIILMFLCLSIVKKIWGLTFHFSTDNNVNMAFFACLFIVWGIVLFKFYPAKKVEIIVEEFDRKTKMQRRVWAVITMLSLPAPIVITCILLIK